MMHTDKRDKPVDLLPQQGVFSARGSDEVLSSKNYRVRLSQALVRKDQTVRIAQRSAKLEEATVQRLRAARENQPEHSALDFDLRYYKDGRETVFHADKDGPRSLHSRGVEQARKLTCTAEAAPKVSKQTPRRLASELESRQQDLQRLKKWNKQALASLAEGQKFVEGQQTELSLHKAQAEELARRVAATLEREELRCIRQLRRPRNPYASGDGSNEEESSKYVAWEELNEVSLEAAMVMHNLSVG
jgi:hypothetical protein